MNPRRNCLAVLSLMLLCGQSCRRADEVSGESAPVQGQPIVTAPATNAASPAPSKAPPATVASDSPEIVEDGFLRLGFDQLSSFKFDVYEVYSETNSGRALLKSDDKIPPGILAYDGRRASVRGFALPLRLKKGKVVEFLLLRDQGACCFGPQAKINHFMRVRYPAGAELEQGILYRVRGTLRVGETYVQGYLTGIYHFEAENVHRDDG